ncbi:sel1 repeat family protein [Alphaproteobacteria bacterium]|nr:sel1 repeat family protein [Alphaproteobacteria bacterium]
MILIIKNFFSIFLLFVIFCDNSYASSYKKAEKEYLNGNYKNVIIQFKSLLAQGNSAAETLTGIMYLKGEGYKANPEIASIWFYKAAKKGNNNAQLVLGSQYLYGLGVKKNFKKAYFWLFLASKSKEVKVSEKAKEFINIAKKSLSDKDQNIVKIKLKEWKGYSDNYN